MPGGAAKTRSAPRRTAGRASSRDPRCPNGHPFPYAFKIECPAQSPSSAGSRCRPGAHPHLGDHPAGASMLPRAGARPSASRPPSQTTGRPAMTRRPRGRTRQGALLSRPSATGRTRRIGTRSEPIDHLAASPTPPRDTVVMLLRPGAASRSSGGPQASGSSVHRLLRERDPLRSAHVRSCASTPWM